MRKVAFYIDGGKDYLIQSAYKIGSPLVRGKIASILLLYIKQLKYIKISKLHHKLNVEKIDYAYKLTKRQTS